MPSGLDDAGAPPRVQARERLDPAVWRIAAVATFGGLLAQLDATIVNVSLSRLAADLDTNLATIQWVTSGYLLALTLVLPLSGWLVHRIGARQLYLWCFAGFAFASALCGLAWSAPSLIGFRLLQGVAGGLLAPMAQMMVARAAGKQLTRVAGVMALPILLAPVLGPVVAGAILQYASWRWLFLVNLPIGALAFVLALLFLPRDGEETGPRQLDWTGLALLSPGLALFLYGADKIGERLGEVALVAGIAMMAGFLRTARRKGDRALIDLRLFRLPVFSTAAVTQFLANGGQFAGQMLIPAFLIEACGRTPAAMGWMLAPVGLGMMVTYPLLGRLVDRFGIRPVSAAGAALAVLATLPFLWFAARGLVVPALLATLFLRGLGMSAVGLPTLTAAYAAIDKRDLPMATTSLNIVQRLGGPTLTTLCASFLAWRLGPEGAAGPAVATAFGWAFALLCALQGCIALATWRLPLRLDDAADRGGPSSPRASSVEARRRGAKPQARITPRHDGRESALVQEFEHHRSGPGEPAAAAGGARPWVVVFRKAAGADQVDRGGADLLGHRRRRRGEPVADHVVHDQPDRPAPVAPRVEARIGRVVARHNIAAARRQPLDPPCERGEPRCRQRREAGEEPGDREAVD